MKLLAYVFCTLGIININAQTEQAESITDNSKISDCTQIVKGEVRDKITNDLLSDAEVVLSGKDGNVLEIQQVKDDATFIFTIKCQTTYMLEARRVDFTSESKHFTTSTEAGKELKLFILLDKGKIDFITNAKAAETKVVAEVVEEQQIEEPKPIAISEELPKEAKNITEGHTITINPIYFDLASSYLSKEAKIELRKVAAIMKNNPAMIIELKAHSDAQGSDKINNWFADRRANRTRDYIIKRGISPNRITAKGYGATQLVNHCSREVECDEEEHAKNRRTEFVIISM